MKTDLIHALTDSFETHAQQADNGVEFWLARDVQHLLGYTEWRNFAAVISKAKTACEVSTHPISDHFVEVTKMVDLGSGSSREVGRSFRQESALAGRRQVHGGIQFCGNNLSEEGNPTMKYREVVIFSGHCFQVTEHIQRLDSRNTRAWQLRYGIWKTFSDHTNDGSGAAAALAAATEELHRRIDRLPAPTGLRQESNSSKSSDLPVGISGPISHTRKGRRVAEYNFGITIPRYGDKPTNKSVYIGTENTITDERFEEALAKAVDIRKKAEKAYQAAATKAKRADIHPTDKMST